MLRILRWILDGLGVLALLALIGGLAWGLLASKILVTDDVPAPAEAIVLLAGDARRAEFAAELYRGGLAPRIWTARPRVDPQNQALAAGGMALPSEAERNLRLLQVYGVEADDVEFYGNNVVSTVDEAEALAKVLPEVLGHQPSHLLLVTSPYHTYRARMVFQDAFPDTTVMAVGDPAEAVPWDWWNDQDASRNVVLETAKLIHYKAGGSFRSDSSQ